MALLGAGMALLGAGVFAVQGVRKTADVQIVAEEGSYRGHFSGNGQYLNDPLQFGTKNGSDRVNVEKVQRGVWGNPRTSYDAPGKGVIVTYGVPNSNSMANY